VVARTARNLTPLLNRLETRRGAATATAEEVQWGPVDTRSRTVYGQWAGWAGPNHIPLVTPNPPHEH